MWQQFTAGLILFMLATAGEAQAAGKHVVCYQGTWSVYRPGAGQFGVEQIDPFLCTHLVYAFLGIKETGELRVIDPYLDLEDNGGRGNLKKFNALKLKNPTLKTLVAVGGWNEGSKRFSQVAADPEKRARFIEDVVQFIQRHGFDGMDLDWEYPSLRHSLPDNNDRENFVTLLKELKQGLEPFSYMLSAAVGSAEFTAKAAYNISAMAPYLDLINVMAYDLHGAWDELVGINAPLYAGANDLTEKQQQLNVAAVVKYWLSQGAPPEKLVLGVPFYGRTFTLSDPAQHAPGAKHSGRGIAGKFSREPGVLGYNELCVLLKEEQQWTQEWESVQQVPYAYKERQWVGYENARSLKLKAEFVLEQKLAGIMIWSLESDDFAGSCGAGAYPLLHEINRVLFGQETPTGLQAQQQQSMEDQDYSCSADVGYVRDSHNCSKFYYCNDGSTYNFECPTGLSFDPNTESCNYSNVVKC